MFLDVQVKHCLARIKFDTRPGREYPMPPLNVIRNPKQADSLVYDCIPQTGPCPRGCSQCFYNRPGAFYTDIAQPSVPNPVALPDGAIVRMNSGHDSNLQRDLVLETARRYPRAFFNTSVDRLDFPGPVVLTVNPQEESDTFYTPWKCGVPNNLMFVRVRVSPSNFKTAEQAVCMWAEEGVPVVLTLMRYYDQEPPASVWPFQVDTPYVFKKHLLNTYWCPTPAWSRAVLNRFRGWREVSLCGAHESGLCKDCRNCETYYLQAAKRLRGE